MNSLNSLLRIREILAEKVAASVPDVRFMEASVGIKDINVVSALGLDVARLVEREKTKRSLWNHDFSEGIITNPYMGNGRECSLGWEGEARFNFNLTFDDSFDDNTDRWWRTGMDTLNLSQGSPHTSTNCESNCLLSLSVGWRISLKVILAKPVPSWGNQLLISDAVGLAVIGIRL